MNSANGMRAAALSALVALGCGTLSAETVGWRTNWTGSYPQADPPTQWGPDKGVVWKCAMPNWSNASPVIVGDKLFVTAEPDVLICVSKADGKILWQKANPSLDALPEAERAATQKALDEAKGLLGERDHLEKEARGLQRKARNDPAAKTQLDELQKKLGDLNGKLKPVEAFLLPRTHGDNGYSSPVPVCDGKLVGCLFGVGTVAVFDLEGNRKWIKALGRPHHDWGTSTSPILSGGKLIVHYANQLIGFDPETGTEAWKTPLGSCWATPTPLTLGGTDLIVTARGEFVRSSDGKVLAKGLSRNEYNGALIVDGIAYFIDESNGAKALQLPATAAEPFQPKELWATPVKKERYYASPVHHDGLLYAITRYGFMTILDAKTGAEVATKDFKADGGSGQPFYPSICIAGKYLVFASEHGKTFVLEPGKEFKEVSRNDLEPTKATPVFEGNKIYLRGKSNLYCLGAL
ncbi:MAG: PQQ-like beta-propeller repeat protein [Planctomycetota bacterium]|nr:PQQ-like beta-propeller repeat protein [Planctomycetota bacterium]